MRKVPGCPWCKQEPGVFWIWLGIAGSYYQVRCENKECPVQPHTHFRYRSRSQAVKAWSKGAK